MTTPAPARTPRERELERLQVKATKGALQQARARALRDQLAFRLWREGMAQDEIAARLDRADRSAGGDGVAVTAVQKTLFRYRKRLEENGNGDGTLPEGGL